MTKQGTSEDVLKTLFPGEEVPICEGHVVTIRPLMLADLPKVADAFGVIMDLAEKGVKASEIAMAGMDELFKILPFCVDRPLSHIPVAIVPDLLEIIVRQNVPDAALGKWKALIQKISAALPKDLSAKLPLGRSRPSKK